MSIGQAMQTGIRGLFANASSTSKMADNIANSNTVGYKRSFASMVTRTSGASAGVSNPAGVSAEIRNEVTKQGPVSSTSNQTDLAISGDGFFIVGREPNAPDESSYRLTRAGSFRPDENGFLKNAAGMYLHGYKYNEDGTMPLLDRTSYDDMSAVNIQNVEMQANGTTEMSIKGNLPSQSTGMATPGAPFQSSAEYFNSLGAKEKVVFDWQPTATDSQWDVTLSDDQGNAYGSVTVDFHDSGPNAGAPETYSGVTNSATPPNNFAFDTTTGTATLTVDNGDTPQTIDIDLGAPDSFDNMTQFSGDYTPQEVTKDGSPSGSLTRTEISEDGIVSGVFDNGLSKNLYEIPLGDVVNPNGLRIEDGNTYSLTRAAGSFTVKTANTGDAGTISSASLENSNVDIAEELTGLIQSQRAYSSNAKVITTADQMLEETTRLKR